MLFLEGDIEPVIIIGILFGVTLINLFIFARVKGRIKAGLPMMTITMFMVYLVYSSLEVSLPLAPYTQVFFITINLVLFIAKEFKE